ncbi:MAG: class B sortase, partial [Oscillospiraceae bacterium]|nr:class B sortase [Oscillospiraceae bacterium]
MRNRRGLFYVASGFVLVTAFGILMLLSVFSAYTEGAQLQDELLQHVMVTPRAEPIDIPIAEPEETGAETAPPETFPLPYGVTLPEIDFEALQEINPHIVGWLVLEGTPINLPLVQGENNYHYLEHLFDGTRNRSGTLFVDTYNRPGFVDDNTIIYG